jgi:hypothetical protein
MAGVACPTCHAYARLEPGGCTCFQGHTFTFARILPKLSIGHDRPNRLRQRALDEAFMYPGRGGEIPILLLERLEEGMRRPLVGPKTR